ncbi:ATP/GTP-binding protein [Oceanirhabdus sp. W0125-5]|uniref:ATP/GTP-binding protein n=1 Tax=Oceanirhabdus sp. W0125-5 TaxID=2999116 RepID=UPI0022F3191D|nr:ATP-binding protein [Oceanirhabdus sp. W0125-5]WBW98761.1 ATP-binding protein [Oceanirhabdus sp. W0125-5]
MTVRIAIIGGPRCGKTTLMQQLYVDMKIMGLSVGCIPEYSTKYLKDKGMIETISEQYGIYLGQMCIDKELEEFDYAITDYATFLPYIYGRFMLGDKKRTTKEIEILKDLYNHALRDINKYDYIFYVPREFGYKKDGVRWQDEELAIAIDNAIKQFIDNEKVPYVELTGNTKDRAAEVLEIMQLVNMEENLKKDA